MRDFERKEVPMIQIVLKSLKIQKFTQAKEAQKNGLMNDSFSCNKSMH